MLAEGNSRVLFQFKDDERKTGAAGVMMADQHIRGQADHVTKGKTGAAGG